MCDRNLHHVILCKLGHEMGIRRTHSLAELAQLRGRENRGAFPVLNDGVLRRLRLRNSVDQWILLLVPFDKLFAVVGMRLCDARAEKRRSRLSLACRWTRFGIAIEDTIGALATRTAHDVG
jgi:hypothetical protein